jgi:hypothetical protein
MNISIIEYPQITSILLFLKQNELLTVKIIDWLHLQDYDSLCLGECKAF